MSKLLGKIICQCGSSSYTLIRMAFGAGNHVKACCANCEKYAQFIPQEEPTEHINHKTALPFGKYKGQAICDLPDDYLRWGVLNLKSKLWKEAFSFELGVRYGEGAACTGSTT